MRLTGTQHRRSTVQPGAATRPDVDAVQFDLHNEAANPVFRDMKGLGLDRADATCMKRVDATLADHAPMPYVICISGDRLRFPPGNRSRAMRSREVVFPPFWGDAIAVR